MRIALAVLFIVALVTFTTFTGPAASTDVGAADTTSTSPLSLVLLALLFPIALVGSSMLHEIARMTAGRISGLQPVIVAMFPFTMRRSVSGWDVHRAFLPNVTVFDSHSLSDERFAIARRRTALAGPTARFGVIFVCLTWLGWKYGQSNGVGDALSHASSSVAVCLSLANLFAIILAFAKSPDPAAMNDGTVTRMLDRPDGSLLLRALDDLRLLKFGVRRPREWTPSEFARIQEGLITPSSDEEWTQLRIECGHLLAMTYVDHGQPEDALRVLAFIRTTWEGTAAADTFIYQHCTVLTAVLVGLQGQGLHSRQILDNLPRNSKARFMGLSKLAKSAALMATGEFDRARRELQPSVRASKRALGTLALAPVEVDLASMIRDEIERREKGGIISLNELRP